MSKRRGPSTEIERLADFTDRLLAAQKPEAQVGPSAELGLAGLQETVRSVRRNLSPRQPDAALRDRIRARLAAEWRTTGPGSRQGAGAPRSSRQFRRRLAAWSALSLALLVLAGAFAARWLPADLTGTAQVPGAALAVILAALAIIGFMLWRRRKRP